MAETEVLPVALTGQRIKLLKAVQLFSERNGYAPSVREMTREMGLASVSTTHTHLLILRDGGIVDWVSGQPRTLRITIYGKQRLAAIGVL